MAAKSTKNQSVANVAEVSHQKTSALQFIRTIYLSLAAVIGLVMFVIGMAGGIRLFMNQYVFQVGSYDIYYSPFNKGPCTEPVYGNDSRPLIGPDGRQVLALSQEEIDDCVRKMEESQKRNEENNIKRDLAGSISLALVGFPVWIFHFMIMQSDWKRKQKA